LIESGSLAARDFHKKKGIEAGLLRVVQSYNNFLFVSSVSLGYLRKNHQT
jgi:hypothetical protein